ncbi:MAG: beta-lactamase family protein [Victivallales bacterium]|nr:beta-lactamase family protein [Victivallales bacterium]
MKKNIIFLIVCLFLFSGINSFCKEEGKYDATAKLARMEAWKAINNGASSITIAIIEDDKLLFAEAFGMIDREKSIQADTDTQFNIGSVSKVFTACAALQLCEQGKLNLDRPVASYLPEFKMKDERYKEITLRMLLNHSSGMPGTNSKDGITNKKNPSYVAETLSVLKNSYLKSKPGEISVYCNDGFIVAGTVIERVSGLNFANYLRKNIFDKAMMPNTSCGFKAGSKNIAHVYDPKTGEARPVEYVNILASGGISSSAVDLCYFAKALYNNKLLKPETMREFTKNQAARKTTPAEGTPGFNCGLGWDSVALGQFYVQGINVLDKSGGTSIPFNCELNIALDNKLAVAVIAAGDANVALMASNILQCLLENKGVLPKHKETFSPQPKGVPIPERILQYEGIYGPGKELAKITFNNEKNTLNIDVLSGRNFVRLKEFIHTGNGRFYFDNDNTLFFYENNNNKYLMNEESNSGRTDVAAEKVEAVRDKLDASEYEKTTWIPRNYSATDLFIHLFDLKKTFTIDELPGRIILTGSPFPATPYAIANKYTTQMILPYLRDQVDMKIFYDKGEKILQMDAFQYTAGTRVPFLHDNECITIGQEGYNTARRIESDNLFQSSLPENGRIIIYSSDGKVSFDTLFNANKKRLVKAGSYILFIGDKGSLFKTTLQTI